MYFSEHNEDVVFHNHSDGFLEVEGNGPVCAEDTVIDESWHWQPEEYTTLSICGGVMEIGAGFLEAFPSLEVLILSRTVEHIEMTPALRKLLHRNRVLIRGVYDSYAEAFAKEQKLHFLHSDIFLLHDRDERHAEDDYVTLRFHLTGKPEIEHDIYSPGSSAGSYGGGKISSKLPGNFYVGCSIEQFAANFHERYREKLLQNEELRAFLEAANRSQFGKK